MISFNSSAFQIPDDHKKGLEIISTIGCSISLLTVTLTIAITVFFWKMLKGPRTVVLVNLCIAIACACLLVITESMARGNKVRSHQMPAESIFKLDAYLLELGFRLHKVISWSASDCLCYVIIGRDPVTIL